MHVVKKQSGGCSMKTKWGLLLVTLLLVVLTASACGSGGKDEAKPGAGVDKPHEPVTLSVFGYNGSYDEDDFDMYFADPVKKKFPYMDVKYIKSPAVAKIQELLTAGEFPDIVLGGGRSVSDLLDAGIPVDLRGLAKKNNLDWNAYEPAAMDVVKMHSRNGEMFGLPIWLNYYVTFYNKDIFDHFGVSYPKDNMTWDDMAALAVKLTRLDNGIQYKGLWPGNISLMARGMSLDYFEPNSNKVKVATDAWSKLFDFGKKIYTIEGNLPGDANLGNLDDNFVKDKNVALLPTYGSDITRLANPNQNNGLNWDMVTYPSFPESKGMSAEADANLLVVSSTSKHQDDAFQVVKYMSTDPTQQLDLARRAGTLPVIQSKQTQEVFGEAFPLMKTKNTKAVFSVKLRNNHPFNKYENVVRRTVDQTFTKWLTTNDDRNSVLRTIEEQANKAVEAAAK
jgi:multiple sugar transport system substrate-binding protein